MNHKRMVKRWKFSWMGHEYHAVSCRCTMKPASTLQWE